MFVFDLSLLLILIVFFIVIVVIVVVVVVIVDVVVVFVVVLVVVIVVATCELTLSAFDRRTRKSQENIKKTHARPPIPAELWLCPRPRLQLGSGSGQGVSLCLEIIGLVAADCR